MVTGCYDWLHSGHIRFFMDAAAYGAVYAVVGSDRNVGLLKGAGHPLQREEERRYMVGAVRSVHRCLVSSGSGWMDAEPEIDAIRPTYYVVNEDGDEPEKRAFCRAHGIEYVVLRRVPARGPARPGSAARALRWLLTCTASSSTGPCLTTCPRRREARRRLAHDRVPRRQRIRPGQPRRAGRSWSRRWPTSATCPTRSPATSAPRRPTRSGSCCPT